MNDGGRRECGAGTCQILSNWHLGDQSEDDKLQSDERAGGRADNNVEVIPTGKGCHLITRVLRVCSR